MSLVQEAATITKSSVAAVNNSLPAPATAGNKILLVYFSRTATAPTLSPAGAWVSRGTVTMVTSDLGRVYELTAAGGEQNFSATQGAAAEHALMVIEDNEAFDNITITAGTSSTILTKSTGAVTPVASSGQFYAFWMSMGDITTTKTITPGSVAPTDYETSLGSGSASAAAMAYYRGTFASTAPLDYTMTWTTNARRVGAFIITYGTSGGGGPTGKTPIQFKAGFEIVADTASLTFDSGLTTGSLIVVAHHQRAGDSLGNPGVGYDEVILDPIIEQGTSGTFTRGWIKKVVGGESTTIAIDAGIVTDQTLIIMELPGPWPDQADLLGRPFGDQTGVALTDNITSWELGPAPITSQDDEVLIAVLGWIGAPGTRGAWTGGFDELAYVQSGVGSGDSALVVAMLETTERGRYSAGLSWATARRLAGFIIPLRINTPTANGQIYAHAGGSTDTTSRVTVRTTPGADVEIRVGTDPYLLTSTTFGPEVADAEGYATVDLTGLTPASEHTWASIIDGVESTSWGHLHTKPVPGTLAAIDTVISSCSQYRDNLSGDTQLPRSIHPVYTWLRRPANKPKRIINDGDRWYQDVNTVVEADHIEPHYDVHTCRVQGPWYEEIEQEEFWSDHDFCGNDSNKNSTGKAAARAAFRRTTPHLPFAFDGTADQGPIHRAWTDGVVRIIRPDAHSDRSPATDPDTDSKTPFGLTGQQWILDELAAADADPDIWWIWFMPGNPWVYVSGDPGAAATPADSMGAYPNSRTIIGNAIAACSTRVDIIHTDMHACAYVLPENNPWGDCAVWCFAAWDREGGLKGGPYEEVHYNSSGTEGQFGRIVGTPNAGSLDVVITANRISSAGAASTLFTDSFTLSAPVEASGTALVAGGGAVVATGVKGALGTAEVAGGGSVEATGGAVVVVGSMTGTIRLIPALAGQVSLTPVD